MSLPLPSSPHWVPTTTVAGTATSSDAGVTYARAPRPLCGAPAPVVAWTWRLAPAADVRSRCERSVRARTSRRRTAAPARAIGPGQVRTSSAPPAAGEQQDAADERGRRCPPRSPSSSWCRWSAASPGARRPSWSPARGRSRRAADRVLAPSGAVVGCGAAVVGGVVTGVVVGGTVVAPRRHGGRGGARADVAGDGGGGRVRGLVVVFEHDGGLQRDRLPRRTRRCVPSRCRRCATTSSRARSKLTDWMTWSLGVAGHERPRDLGTGHRTHVASAEPPVRSWADAATGQRRPRRPRSIPAASRPPGK